MSGLYFVTLPIGNPKDITQRAIELLNEVNLVFSEDTRVFKDLAKNIGLDLSSKRVFSFHEHSGDGSISNIIERSKTEKVAIVSDAGSPVISDPAYPLIKKSLQENISIHSCGGISSVIVALELSGLPAIPFHFHGFLSRDKGKIKEELEAFANSYGTHIFFEGKSRVSKTLEVLSGRFPDFEMAVCRELTKEHESVYRFMGRDYDAIKNEITILGEFVILVYNPEKKTSNSSKVIKEMAEQILSKGAKPKLLAKLISEITGENSKQVYEKLNNKR